MIGIAIDVAEGEIDDLDGRSLGHITIRSDTGTATSEGKTPGQAMMVFLSVPLLLDGLRRFVQSKGERTFRFNGTGSSFAIVFSREAGDRLKVTSGSVDLGTHPIREVVEAIWTGVRGFFKAYFDALDMNDMAYDDLETAAEEFQEAFGLPDL